MKRVALKDVPPLAEHVADLEREPVVLTRNGRAVAAVVALPNADAETVSLSTHPGFLAIIERSRRRHERRGGISVEDMRRRLGRSAATRKKPTRKDHKSARSGKPA